MSANHQQPERHPTLNPTLSKHHRAQVRERLRDIALRIATIIDDLNLLHDDLTIQPANRPDPQQDDLEMRLEHLE